MFGQDRLRPCHRCGADPESIPDREGTRCARAPRRNAGAAGRSAASKHDDLRLRHRRRRHPRPVHGILAAPTRRPEPVEIDEQLSSWRYRHMNMVHRMIGTRIGTGGSTGKDYLKAAADKHYIFKEIAQLNSFLAERRKLPQLSTALEKMLGFVAA